MTGNYVVNVSNLSIVSRNILAGAFCVQEKIHSRLDLTSRWAKEPTSPAVGHGEGSDEGLRRTGKLVCIAYLLTVCGALSSADSNATFTRISCHFPRLSTLVSDPQSSLRRTFWNWRFLYKERYQHCRTVEGVIQQHE